VPTVPSYGGNKVQQTGLPGARANVEAPIEAFGGGKAASQPIEAALQVSQSAQKIVLEEKQKADDTATTEFYTKLASKKQELFWDPKAGVINRKGKESFAALDDYGQEFDKFADDLEKGLANDDQRQMAKKIRQRERLEFDGQIHRHISQEAKQFEDQTIKAGIDTARNDGVLNYYNPAKVADSIKLQESLVMKAAAGKPPALVQAEMQSVRSSTHAEIVSRMLSNGQDLDAKKHFEANQAMFTADDTRKLEGALREGSVRGESQRQASSIMASAGQDMKTAISAARAIKDPGVQEATVREVKLRFAENEAAKRDADEKNVHDVFNFITENKKQVDANRFANLSPEAKRSAEAWLEHVRKGTQPETDWNLYTDLKMQAATPQMREKFLQTNIYQYRTLMADTEYKEMVGIWTALKKGDEDKAKELDGYRTNNMIVDDTLSAAGINQKKHAEKVNLFRKSVDEKVIELQQKTGKKATNEEVQGIVDSLIVPGTVPGTGILGFFQTKRRAFEAKEGEKLEFNPKDIPRSERAKIEDSLRRNNKPVNDRNILDLYTRKINSQVPSGS
jgi:hypothetical protein